MMRKLAFLLAYSTRDRHFSSRYKNLVRNQWNPYKKLLQDQEKQLKNMIDFSYKNVPYYHELFKKLRLKPENIKKIENLEKLPILTKDIINQHYEKFKPLRLQNMNYYRVATGGSTGTPLKYRVAVCDYNWSVVLKYRGWGYGGYNLADKTAIMGGSSLIPTFRFTLEHKIHEFVKNIKFISSFDMSESEMNYYLEVLNKFKPTFIYGYPSSIYFFAQWIKENNKNLSIDIKGVFTTAEKLFSHMRETLHDVFHCEVYDTYGLNDGGLSAYECPEHNGLHIDTERSIMELVDTEGNQLEKGEGKILATSLHNYAMPFVRYDTGDVGSLTDEMCSCGREYPLLKEMVGRSVDFLITPEGKNVHGWFFLYIFWEYCKGIKEYQVVQKTIDTIIIKIVPREDFDEKQLQKIREVVKKRSEGWNIEFKLVDKIERTRAGKYKFIINNIKSDTP